MIETEQRLCRSRDDSIVLGVCGGIGRYVGIDPVAVRVVWIVVTFLTAIVPMVLAYLAAAVVMPGEPYRCSQGERAAVRREAEEQQPGPV
jgi:phage shock protein C